MSEYLEIKWAKIKLRKPIIDKEFYIRGDGDHQFGASSKLHYDVDGNTYLHVCFCPTVAGTFSATLYFHDRIYRNGNPWISKVARYKVTLTGTKAVSDEWMYFYDYDLGDTKWSLFRFNSNTIEKIAIDDVTLRIPGIEQERVDRINGELSLTGLLTDTPITDVGSILDNSVSIFNNNDLCSTLPSIALSSILKQKPFNQMNNLELNLIDQGDIHSLNDGLIQTQYGYVDQETNTNTSIDTDLYYFRKIRKSSYKFGLHNTLGMVLYTGKTQDFTGENAIQLTNTSGYDLESDYYHFADMCEYDGIIYGISNDNSYSIIEVVIDPVNRTISFTKVMLEDIGINNCVNIVTCLYNVFGGIGQLNICMCVEESNLDEGNNFRKLYSKSFGGSYADSYDITSSDNSYDNAIFAMFANNPILICKGSSYIAPSIYVTTAFSFSFEESFYATELWSIQTGLGAITVQFNGDDGYYWNIK